MTTRPASVVIVSRGRPQALTRCLAGVAQLDHPAFEVVVVADPPGCAAVKGAGLADAVKLVEYDEANVSAARNAGIARAAGAVVAFIDDDAVPEPTWLRHLAVPFEDEAVASATGWVRGRNGISFQSRGSRVDALGEETPIEGTVAQILPTAPGDAVKTVGTNCAFRRRTLADMGGFDPVFRFFLDETDVNLRLAAQRHPAAIVPLAQVHHGYLAGAYRRADRVPRSLHEIGASMAAFLRKHGPDGQAGPRLDRFRAEQKARLIRHMVDGRCEPRDVRRLMQSLESGIAEGMARGLAPLPPIGPAGCEFRPFPSRFSGHVVIAGRSWQRRSRQDAAREAVAGGSRASVFLFSPTALYHRVAFRAEGYWLQTGGIFGRSRRDDPLFRPWSFRRRLSREIARISALRGPG